MRWFRKKKILISHSKVNGGKCSASTASTQSTATTLLPEKKQIIKCAGCRKKLGFYFAPYPCPYENIYCKVCAKIKKLTE